MEQFPLKHGGEYTLINMFIGCAMCIHLSCPFLNPFIHQLVVGVWDAFRGGWDLCFMGVRLTAQLYFVGDNPRLLPSNATPAL